jgi:hypothetical protein
MKLRLLILPVLVGLCATAQKRPPAADWTFVASGDSRDCGDVVMPAIAEGARRYDARFYWHLGDLRHIADDYAGTIIHPDADYVHEPNHRGRPVDNQQYLREAWDDFIHSQMEPFRRLPFVVGIGNHELVKPLTREDFIRKFGHWLDAPYIRTLRLKDDPNDRQPHTYFHWIQGGVDFIYLDDAEPGVYNFDAAQLAWFERVIGRAARNPEVKTLVVGMHAALPDSIAIGHSMSDTDTGRESGRRVYRALLDFQEKTKKRVYALASHSHFFLSNLYNTEYWQQNGGVLPGWLVGTAGAVRYPVPSQLWRADEVRQKVYGYLLATVHPDGSIDFDFQEIKRRDVPAAVVNRFTPELVSYCFEKNTDFRPPAAAPIAP